MALPAALTMQMQRSPLAALVQERGRLFRFALTGGLAALTQLLLLELLVGQGAPAIAANVSAFIVAAQVNFWLSSLFTWRDRAGAPGMAGLAGRWLRFHGAILGTAVLNLAVFSVSVTVLPHLMAAVLGIGAAAAANFVSGDRFVFRRARAISSMSTRRGAGRPGSVRTAGGQVVQASASPPAALDPSGQSVDAPLLEDRDADLPADALDLRDGGPMHTSPRAVPIWRRGRLWARLGMSGVMLLAAGLYCWGLARNGFGNEYYTAAALSGALSWKAFFYGALDPGSFITVDKPPFAIWVQSLSVRLFGLSSWSVLLPQALAALGTLAAVMVMTRRQFGAVSAILAGLALALTPITVAVARVNLPDNVLILLLVLGAWATLAAARTGRLRLLLLGMALVGIGFNTKMLQAFVVVPAFSGTYLLAAPGGLLRRLAHLTAAGLVLLAVSASWMLVVDSVPADARPYIGGSSDNSVLDLTLGYNGLGRIFGQGLTRSASPTEIVTRVAEAVKTAMQPADETTTAAADGDGARGFGPGG
ncbi:MAG: glycosyltransferase family 39 protein, partial [Chloroflexota bacterium]